MILSTEKIGANHLIHNITTGSYEISEDRSKYRLTLEQAQTLIYYYKKFSPKFPVKDWLNSLRPFVKKDVIRLSSKI